MRVTVEVDFPHGNGDFKIHQVLVQHLNTGILVVAQVLSVVRNFDKEPRTIDVKAEPEVAIGVGLQKISKIE